MTAKGTCGDLNQIQQIIMLATSTTLKYRCQ